MTLVERLAQIGQQLLHTEEILCQPPILVTLLMEQRFLPVDPVARLSAMLAPLADNAMPTAAASVIGDAHAEPVRPFAAPAATVTNKPTAPMPPVPTTRQTRAAPETIHPRGPTWLSALQPAAGFRPAIGATTRQAQAGEGTQPERTIRSEPMQHLAITSTASDSATVGRAAVGESAPISEFSSHQRTSTRQPTTGPQVGAPAAAAPPQTVPLSLLASRRGVGNAVPETMDDGEQMSTTSMPGKTGTGEQTASGARLTVGKMGLLTTLQANIDTELSLPSTVPEESRRSQPGPGPHTVGPIVTAARDRPAASTLTPQSEEKILEQLLEKLQDELELALLRTYGTSGN